jgi:hypothetical protein
MKRLLMLLCILFGCIGCATESDRAQWNELWKDARGDNMQMRGFGGANGSDDGGSSLRSRN